MNINDVIRVQEGFKQSRQNNKISKEIIEKQEYNVINELMGKFNYKKGKNDKNQVPISNTKQSNPDYNLSLSGPRPPMWDAFWTKRDPIMTDEEFEKEITALAIEFAEKSMEIGNSGKGKAMINSMLDKLRNEYNYKHADLLLNYVSVVSPDRKAAYANSDFTKGNIVSGNEKNFWGENTLMSWGPSGWSQSPTAKEMERMSKFDEIYMNALRAYEAEHGQIPYTTISRAVAPPRNYF